MINREMEPVEVLTYTEINSVGQKRMGTPTSRSVEMFIKVNTQNNVADPRYVDCDLIGLTKDYTITTSNVIKYDGIKYNVKYLINTPRYLVVYLKNNEK